MAGETIKKLRKEAGMTQRKLAKLSGFTQQCISKYENNESNIDYKTLQKICVILDAEIRIVKRTEV